MGPGLSSRPLCITPHPLDRWIGAASSMQIIEEGLGGIEWINNNPSFRVGIFPRAIESFIRASVVALARHRVPMTAPPDLVART